MEARQDIGLEKSTTSDKANLILFVAGKFVSLFGTFIYSFAIGLYVLEKTSSGLSFASSIIFSMLPRVILGPIAGVVADRLDRKKIAVGMDFICGILMLSFFILSKFDGIKIHYVYLFSFLLSTANVFFDVAMEASKPNLVDNKNLTRLNSLSQSITSIASISGPFLGGIVYGFFNIQGFLFFNGICFILSAISEAFIDFEYNRPKEQNKERETRPMLQELKEGVQFFRNNKVLFSIMSFSLLINFAMQLSITVPLPYILTNTLELSSSQYGTVKGFWPAGMLVGSILLSFLPQRDKIFKQTAVLFTIFICILMAVALPVIPIFSGYSKGVYFVYYIIVMGLGGMVVAFIDIPIMVVFQRLIPDEVRGRVLSLIGTMAVGIAPIGLLLAGILIDHIPTWILPICAGVLLIVKLISFIKDEELKKLL
ncbi:MFS transporter [Alkaliphilus sp. MSJ-5]|uniref:MFS transporter n=1 Tax=Alkaliphilus flagellatus TaxID=2841507 RepID=A0ABS6FY61_9FIRM|nr:MFS transporter [Alkaliphilus flagellatus]MBU5674846.1 MFS transporter [Alkaliphilus flagellatus]